MIYFVATPIGNLDEITYRAVEILKNSDVIFCEDTRHSSILLNRLGVKAPLKSYHKFNEAKSCDFILSLSREGKTVSVISDAGMPGISDPGRTLVNACIEAGEEYGVVSGASAAINAFVSSGFDTPFVFVGFLPEKNGDKDKIIESVVSAGTLIFYSAPHDLNDTLDYLKSKLGEDRRVAICKELTKLHETVIHTTLGQAYLDQPKGEFVIVVDKASANENALNGLTIEQHVEFYVDKGMSKMDAIKATAKDLGVGKNEVYKALL